VTDYLSQYRSLHLPGRRLGCLDRIFQGAETLDLDAHAVTPTLSPILLLTITVAGLPRSPSPEADAPHNPGASATPQTFMAHQRRGAV
jgi:hypothetical protein